MKYYEQESERLIYRKLVKSDNESWSEFFIDNPNLPYLGLPHNLSIEEMSPMWLEVQFERYRKTNFGGLAAVCKSTGDLIGITGLLVKEVKNQTEYEIAYSLKPKYWLQGYASEMSATMKQFATDNKIHSRVISIIHKDNIGSIKVAQKNAMQFLFSTEFKKLPCLVYGVEI